VLVLVELTALQYINASAPVFLQLFLAIIDPFFDVMKTVTAPVQKFGINVRSRYGLNWFQLCSAVPEDCNYKLVIDRPASVDRISQNV
jgi:hypothetical protein